jgi:isopropylmalate/homocitrate/citramalate synthase
MDTPDTNTPWHTDRWFTSPWNHDDEVARTWADMPDEIQIHDVTLRDGEQQAGVMFTADDKMRIAEKLAEAGVHRIEAGLPAVSEQDEKAVTAIAKMDLPSKVYAFSRCMVPDVQKAIDCGVEGIIIEIPSSRHLIELGYKWSVERAVELSIESTKYAHDNGLEVSFFPIDATRAAMSDYINLVSTVAAEGHMDALVLVDTMGVLTPHAVERFTRVSREQLDVPLETHFHMDYGCAVANSLIAIGAGASTIQTTIGGIGERAGNCPMEEAVLALLTLYNRDIGIKTEKLAEVHRFVMDLAGVQQPSNRPVTGDRLFSVESGIIATWVRNTRGVDITESVPYLPSLVGQAGPDIVLGKGSGLDSIADALERAGAEQLDEDRALELLTAVKTAALDKRDLLDLDEFKELLHEIVG